jgi:hypothetical protein
MRWYNSGPNNNSDRDAGWTTTMVIPWAAIGGPPASGSNLGLGVQFPTATIPLRPAVVRAKRKSLPGAVCVRR